MRRTIDATNAPSLVLTAQQTSCLVCQGPVHICHHRRRVVVRLDGPYRVIRRDKRCPDSECAGHSTLYRPMEDIRLALPYKMFGLDVICWVGQQHLGRSLSLRQIGRDLNDKKVPIDQTHVGELLRDYLALCQLSHPAEAVLQKLRAQGGNPALGARAGPGSRDSALGARAGPGPRDPALGARAGPGPRDPALGPCTADGSPTGSPVQ